MSFWASYGYVRYLLWLVAGILLARYWTVDVRWLLLVGGISVLAYALVWALARRRDSGRLALGGLVAVALVAAGGLLVRAQYAPRYPHHLRHLSLDSISSFRAELREPARPRSSGWQAEATVTAVRLPRGWQPATGRVLLRVHGIDTSQTPHYGDVLLVRGAPRLVSPPLNPGEFDYRRYLTERQVYHTAYARAEGVVLLARNPPSRWRAVLYRWRTRALAVLETHLKPRAYAVAAALVLGDKSALDPTVRTAYARAGAMHVLAVSGLHVGIVYGVIVVLMGWIQRQRVSPWWFAGLSISLLWTYAGLTGFSPSVRRAATMFSMLAVGRASRRRGNTFNLLAASAFVLLTLDPSLLFQVGFQLSYAAVVGILWWQPPLSRLWSPVNLVVDYFWQLTTVSVAAQLATLPLSVYYFYQVPVYGLLTSFFVIPGALVAVVGGLLLVGTGVLAELIPILTTVAGWLGWAYQGWLDGLNFLIFWMEGLPGAVREGFQVYPAEVLALYLTLAGGALTLLRREAGWLVPTAALLVVLGGWNVYERHQQRQTCTLTIYSVPRHSAVGLRDGTALTVWADSQLVAAPAQADYQLRGHWASAGLPRPAFVTDVATAEPVPGCRVLVWDGRTVVWLSAWPPDRRVRPADVVVLQKDAARSLPAAHARFGGALLVADGTNTALQRRRWAKQARAHPEVRYHDLLADGALVLNAQE